MMIRSKWLRRRFLMPAVLVAVLLLQLPVAAISAVCPMTHQTPVMVMDHSDDMPHHLMTRDASGEQDGHGCCGLDSAGGDCLMIACLWMAADLPDVSPSASSHGGARPDPGFDRLQRPPLFPLFRPPIA